MSTDDVIPDAFVFVSVLSLLIQVAALRRLPASAARRGLHRTAASRVFASVVYVLVGLNAVTVQVTVLRVTFAAFAITQITWWINSVLDVRLNRRPSPTRRPRRIQITIVRDPKPTEHP